MQYLLTKEELDKLNGDAMVRERCEDYRNRLCDAIVHNMKAQQMFYVRDPRESIQQILQGAMDATPVIPPPEKVRPGD